MNALLVVLEILTCAILAQCAWINEMEIGKPCEEALGEVDKSRIGAYIPQCKDDGSYKAKQCSGSTGSCWCVETMTGKEICGTGKGPGKGRVTCVKPCEEELSKVDKSRIGAYVPQCKDDGSYKVKQCSGSTGYCWCVETKTGKEISGTRKGPTKGRVICGITERSIEKACDKALTEVDKSGVGAFIPQCKADGSYKAKQCHASTGYCWCVETKAGKEICGSEKGPGRGRVICEKACEKALAEALAKARGRIGAYIPQCKADGSYKAKQWWGSTGESWCVNTKTGKEILGTRKGPTEGTVRC